jgi:predicted nucleic acid-binding protein
MSRYVVDASVALRSVLFEPDSDKALQLLEDFRKGVHELLVPDVFQAEVGNAHTRAERKKVIALGDATVFFDEIMDPSPSIHSSSPLMARAIDLSSRTRASVYDCLYLLLAEDEHCEVITADVKFFSKFHTTGKLIDLSTL